MLKIFSFVAGAGTEAVRRGISGAKGGGRLRNTAVSCRIPIHSITSETSNLVPVPQWLHLTFFKKVFILSYIFSKLSLFFMLLYISSILFLSNSLFIHLIKSIWYLFFNSFKKSVCSFFWSDVICKVDSNFFTSAAAFFTSAFAFFNFSSVFH